jgi:hypothetical protein
MKFAHFIDACLSSLLLLFVAYPEALTPPILSDSVVGVLIDIDGDGDEDFQTFAGRDRYPHPGTDIQEYAIGLSLQNLGPNLLLTVSDKRIPFRHGESVSSLSPRYSDIGGGNWIIVGRYVELFIPDGPWTYQDAYKDFPGSFWRTERSLLIGCRVVGEDGVHFGWMRLTRPDLNFTTPFDVESFDWNPLPGEPIKAGQPPEIPLAPEITEEGLRLRWPAVLATWMLEYADSLDAEAEWIAIPEAANGEIVLPIPETARFYRLRRL